MIVKYKCGIDSHAEHGYMARYRVCHTCKVGKMNTLFEWTSVSHTCKVGKMNTLFEWTSVSHTCKVGKMNTLFEWTSV